MSEYVQLNPSPLNVAETAILVDAITVASIIDEASSEIEVTLNASLEMVKKRKALSPRKLRLKEA